ncbi:MAG: SLBB domain-containing protein [Terriglobia bacterium]|nr:SLBB domain-containing protein [Terriglobia bacterium]
MRIWLLILSALVSLGALAQSANDQRTVPPTPQPAVTRPEIDNRETRDLRRNPSLPSRTRDTDRLQNEKQWSDKRSPERQWPEETRPAEPEPETQTEFQKFVQESLGHELPVFGHELFVDVPSTFAPVDQIPVTADYVIGPGDELLLRAWGAVDVDLQLVVDRNGQVQIPKVGSLTVAGLRYEQLPGYVRTSMERVFRGFDMTVTLGQLRSIQVFVVGNVKRPGSYTVSSLSTLVNAVFDAGGPTARGSMRHIQLRRGAKIVVEFDLYDLLHGDKSKDVPLLPGDVVYVPPVAHVVAVDGSVQVPGIYELRGGSTLGDVVNLAGGLAPTASTRRVVIERIEGRESRRVLECGLDDQGLRQTINNGDVIRIDSVSPKFDDTITLRGNVANPGRYAFKSGMRIRDIIPSREFLVTRDYWQRQNRLVARVEPLDETQSQSQSTNDSVNTIDTSSSRSYARAGDSPDNTSSQDSPQKPTDETQLRNEVQRNGADINWAYALVQRMKPDLSTELLPFNLARALNGDAADNLELQPGDVITIFSQADIAVPANRQSRYVRIEGEVNAAGVYRVNPGETLRDLLRRAGGPTAEAYLFAAQFDRESVKEEQTERYEKYLDQLDQELSRHAADPGQDKQDAEERALETERQKRMVAELRKIQPTGRIVLGLNPDAHSIDDFPNVELEDGDRLFIPRQPATVNVMGAVYNENAFLFAQHQSVKSYLQRAGGGTRDADEKKTFIIRADGSLVSREGWMGRKSGFSGVLPGDTIVLPLRLERANFMRNLKDWSQVISQFALGVAAVHVLNQ